ncbi:uncharacterized protein LOC129939146 [Eupeodes corollae]|uniref:uncharacterized protein LOC129939146 n=1 Tax=Eupeodes corollae TaxID=290404 RepID=UPI0024900C32|nr:uncharacterized protein LOC129939146 [Eupeodes corollae]
MKRFLQGLNITTASRIVFFDKWQQWKIEIGSIPFNRSLDDFSCSVIHNSSTPTTSSSSPLLYNTSASKKLMDILNWGNEGETIKSYFQINNNIDNKSVRSLLLNTIVNYSSANNVYFSSKDLMQLAEEIRVAFNEDPLDYYDHKKGVKNPKGILANKFHNMRGKFRSINRLCMPESKKKLKLDDALSEGNSGDEDKVCMQMKHDFLAMNAQERIKAWESTFNVRQSDLKKANSKTISWSEFYEKWHFINFPNGYEYIESDFNKMFGNKDIVLAGPKMNDFINLMLQFIFPKKIINTEIRLKLHEFNLKCLSDPNSNIVSKNTRAAMVFTHLHYLLQPSGREGNKRFTVFDSQDASIRLFAQQQDYKEHQNALAAKHSQSQPPLITLIGHWKK